MIHVGDMLQIKGKKEKKIARLYPVVLQVVCFLRSSRTCGQKQCVHLPT